MSSANLANGPYFIRSVQAAAYVGRYVIEDKSLLPKRILAAGDTMLHATWTVTKNGDTYTLNAFGAPVGVNDGLVYSFLVEEDKAEKWKITEHTYNGKKAYAVHTNDNANAWSATAKGEEEGQVKVTALTSPVDPSQLFEFQQLAPA